ncbi:MAG: sigma-54-dependent Fis family transcriptional regulator [Candidatus Mcinerneyibacterium aminivorans]|uniref:Sigma-54-dependent Fis family transcriptional regulator n=1 Tax=Candidatus Mcinerneyibacterium aminivorans TaxID=2703815 RepID=A0A5D0MB06_9BACT|nr:MAG: sigma-54-dependent Fis family transcriptional regulator [Candidatus Mcinerneyibacterium aminivorans]
MANILVLDDEKGMREFLEIMLTNEGYSVSLAATEEKAVELVKKNLYDLVISDLRLKEGSGIDFLKKLKDISPSTYFIIITAYATLDTAIEAIKLGAFDYILKPFKIDMLRKQISSALERKSLIEENLYLRDRINKQKVPRDIIFNDEKIESIYNTAIKAAQSESTILLTGESGTGKEMFARLIHNKSFRSDGPFVVFNCGALSENLLESELFGHIAGSFTGANKNKDGLFVVAEGGSIFLDEIAETTNNFQVKLLRAIQEKEIKPVGSNSFKKVDVRIIAASNKNLEKQVEKGNFRKDLYYRLNVIPIHIPPLRERKNDIPRLAKHFLDYYSNGQKKIVDEAMQILIQHDYPGNVRELENIMERVSVLSRGKEITPEDLKFMGSDFDMEVQKSTSSEIKTLKEIEKEHIKKVLKLCNGNKSKTARKLEVSRRFIYKKINEYNINLEDING